MKKNIIIVLMMAIIMPLYFFSDLGYTSQSRMAPVFPSDEEDRAITDESALNPASVEAFTAVNGKIE